MHPLDRPIWHSLTTRHSALAEGNSRAWRMALYEKLGFTLRKTMQLTYLASDAS